jgi:exopolysaccharide biosynthesis polyprenyl glycosylphosphotransferase
MSATRTARVGEAPEGTALPKQYGGNGVRPRRAAGSRWKGVAGAIFDALLICGTGLLAYKIRFAPDLSGIVGLLEHPLRNSTSVENSYAGFLLLYVALIVTLLHSQGLYRQQSSRSSLNESLLVVQAVGIATLLLTTGIYLSGIKVISRLVVGLCAALSVIALCGWRLCRDAWVRNQRGKGIGSHHTLIVGAGRVGELLAEQFEKNPTLGYMVRGFLDSNHHQDPRILGKVKDLAEVSRKEFIDEIFITIPSERELVKSVVLEARRLGLNVKVIPELYDGLAWRSPIEFIGEFPVSVLHREPIPSLGLFLKRFTDIIASALGLVVIFPILGLIAVAIKIDSPGPAFYRAYRVGRKGKKFLCYKFRTMVVNADELKSKLRSLNERQGPFFKITGDPRITWLGRFLRKYSLDELPQLWNVLKGEMSLVGPRPHPQDDYQGYALEHFRRLDVTPGITCLWQVTARHDPSFEKVLALDTQYIENWNYLLDVQILLKTIPVIFSGTGQ